MEYLARLLISPTWRAFDYFKLFLYAGSVFVAISELLTHFYDPVTSHLLLAMGGISAWRYAWWGTHFVRGRFFADRVFPLRRERANQLWAGGWRPPALVFMVTTYKERPEITARVFNSIVQQVMEIGVPAHVFVGTGDYNDERTIDQFMQGVRCAVPIQVTMIRQTQPGKRIAIGRNLRAMLRHGVGGDTPIVFMDGDSVLEPTCLAKCLPFFKLFPRMHALTTNESAVVYGPAWIKRWIEMRFVQRHLGMLSNGLSDKVLTLTGRMSVFRARAILNLTFIRTVEADHLDHWLWSRFRFLSGDDKSTWYYLLGQGALMGYVPDAMVTTIENIEGNGRQRMLQNYMRWSGNMLRNGQRAIALGPKRVGLFTWWCLVDQRISMWTTLIGPVTVIASALFVSLGFLLFYIVWIALTRFVMSVAFFRNMGTVYLTLPAMMYANQILNSVLKVYLLFRLPKQRWTNRNNQRVDLSTGPAWKGVAKKLMAGYITMFWVMLFVFIILVYLKLVSPARLDFLV